MFFFSFFFSVSSFVTKKKTANSLSIDLKYLPCRIYYIKVDTKNWNFKSMYPHLLWFQQTISSLFYFLGTRIFFTHLYSRQQNHVYLSPWWTVFVENSLAENLFKTNHDALDSNSVKPIFYSAFVVNYENWFVKYFFRQWYWI